MGLGDVGVLGAEGGRLHGQGLAVERLRLGEARLLAQELRELVEERAEAGVLGAEGLAASRHRLAVEALRLPQVALEAVELRHVVPQRHELARDGRRARLLEGEGLGEPPQGLGVPVLVAVEAGQVVEQRRRVGRAEGEGAGEERLGLTVAALRAQILGEVAEGIGQELRPAGLQAIERRGRRPEESLRLLEAVEAIEAEGEILPGLGHVEVALALRGGPQGEDATVQRLAAAPVARVVRQLGELLENRHEREVVSADGLLAPRELARELVGGLVSRPGPGDRRRRDGEQGRGRDGEARPARRGRTGLIPGAGDRAAARRPSRGPPGAPRPPERSRARGRTPPAPRGRGPGRGPPPRGARATPRPQPPRAMPGGAAGPRLVLAQRRELGLAARGPLCRGSLDLPPIAGARP